MAESYGLSIAQIVQLERSQQSCDLLWLPAVLGQRIAFKCMGDYAFQVACDGFNRCAMSMETIDYRNPDLPLEERVKALLGALTLEEKCAQLRYNAPAIERLGIPAYNWWNEALHGVGRAGRATVFPQAIGMAAMWDVAMTERIASAISDEARAKHHEANRRGSHQQYQGLTFWTPNINIFRDPRWGRGQETWGEDPFFTGEMGAAFVRGLQGEDPHYLKTSACAKHFAVHSGPEADRHTFDACPPRKDFAETYLPAFQRLVEAGVESVMPAYNRVYGEPCAGSTLLLQEILRERWGFKGHVVSDCWALVDFHMYHKVTANAEESAAMAIKAGCDLNCGSVYCSSLLDAVHMGLCSEADVDRALARLLRTRFRLGMFDPEERVPFSRIPLSVVGCDAHRQLALQAAQASLVLLKNANNALPLGDETRYMVLGGPHAVSVEALLGNYFGLSTRMVTLFEGIAEFAPPQLRIDYRKGCLLDMEAPNKGDWSIFEAASADALVLALGLDGTIEGEEGDAIQSATKGDRARIELPPNQIDYLQRVRKRIEEQKSQTKIIVILFCGSAVAIPEVHELADAVLQVWYPGEAGGTAIAQALFGHTNPSGRLPVTVPYRTEDLPAFDDYAMAGRTYRYMPEEKMLYPFGYGLSYSRFGYALVSKEPLQVAVDAVARVQVDVANTSDRDGDEVVQAYLKPVDDPDAPTWTLAAFQRVAISAGQTRRVELSIDPSRFNRYDADGNCLNGPGQWQLHIGGALPVARSGDLGAARPVMLPVHRTA